MRIKTLNDAGETIVEVLISIAMLSLAIVASIVIARESLLIGQAANERTQAVKIAETQLERLKFLATDPVLGQPGSGIYAGTNFCIEFNGATSELELISTPVSAPTCSNSYFPDSNLDVVITYDAIGPTASLFDDDLFTIAVAWDGVDGEGRDSVIIDYRLHPVN